MKNSIISLILFILVSSCKPEYVKIKDKLEGSWKLTNFDYLNIQGDLVSDKNTSYHINFKNDNKGIFKINTMDFNFTYDFGYEQFDSGYANCNIDVENKTLLPINAIGKVQVYSYKFTNTNTIEFYAEKEYDFIDKQLIKNVTYTFIKI